MKTCAEFYAEASRLGYVVRNLYNATPTIYGCRIGLAGALTNEGQAYAQGETPAQAMERAIATMKRIQNGQR